MKMKGMGDHPRKPESSAIALRGKSSTPLSESISQLMAQVSANFPSQETGPSTQAMWKIAWVQLAEQYGLADLRAALMLHCGTKRWLPLPADVLEALEMVKASAAAGRTRFIPCGKCHIGLVPGNRGE